MLTIHGFLKLGGRRFSNTKSEAVFHHKLMEKISSNIFQISESVGYSAHLKGSSICI